MAERRCLHRPDFSPCSPVNFFIDVLPLHIAQFRVIVRITIYLPEEPEEKQAYNAGECKAPAPADQEQYHADERNTQGRSKFCRCIKDGSSKAAFFSRKPKADGLCIRREGRSLTDTENQSSRE